MDPMRNVAIDARIEVASPPSIVLEAIKRYLELQHNIIHLLVPLKDTDALGTVALESKVLIDHEPHPNRAMISRYDDRLVVRWKPLDGAGPSFEGRLTIRPQGTGTELHLKGCSVLPTQPINTYVPGAALDEHAAEAMIRSLLETLKSIIEAEFGAVRDFCTSRQQLVSRQKSRTTTASLTR